MKTRIIFAAIWMFTVAAVDPAAAASKIEFRTSKILGLWEFLYSTVYSKAHYPYGSETLREVYENSSFNNETNRTYIHRFEKILENHFDGYYPLNGFPFSRKKFPN